MDIDWVYGSAFSFGGDGTFPIDTSLLEMYGKLIGKYKLMMIVGTCSLTDIYVLSLKRILPHPQEKQNQFEAVFRSEVMPLF